MKHYNLKRSLCFTFAIISFRIIISFHSLVTHNECTRTRGEKNVGHYFLKKAFYFGH